MLGSSWFWRFWIIKQNLAKEQGSQRFNMQVAGQKPTCPYEGHQPQHGTKVSESLGPGPMSLWLAISASPRKSILLASSNPTNQICKSNGFSPTRNERYYDIIGYPPKKMACIIATFVWLTRNTLQPIFLVIDSAALFWWQNSPRPPISFGQSINCGLARTHHIEIECMNIHNSS